MKVYSTPRIVKGKTYTYWCLDLGMVKGKRIRTLFGTEKDALTAKRQHETREKLIGKMATQLSQSQLIDALQSYEMLRNVGITESLNTVTEFFIKHNQCLQPIKLTEAFDRYLEKFSVSQDTQLSLVRNRVGRIVSLCSKDIVTIDVTTSIVEEIFNTFSTTYAPKTYNNYLNYAKTFFTWLIKQNYMSHNPVEKLEKMNIEYEEPKFITAKNLKRLLHEIEDTTLLTDDMKVKALQFMTLSYFCGIRTSEIARVKLSSICLTDSTPYIRLSKVKGATQGVKGRMIDLEPNAVRWINTYFADGVKLNYGIVMRMSKAIIAVSESLDIPFYHNQGRHSYITHHIAKYRNPQKTELMVGTSADMRTKHYQGLTPESTGISYFDILPTE